MDKTAAEFPKKSVTGGAIAGFIAVITYLSWSIFPIPSTINMLMHFSFGILLIMAFVGIYKAFRTKSDNYFLTCSAIFGMLGGTMFMLMTVVQHSNIAILYDVYQSSEGADRAMWGKILRGVDSIQLGMDICWDIFITLSTILLGIVMLKYNLVVKILGVLGICVSLLTLFLNLYTFPMPPSQAGLFDAGPLVGSWYTFVCILLLKMEVIKKEKLKERTEQVLNSGTLK